jgi:HAD superfamily hydrolase (TIGR01509 family)
MLRAVLFDLDGTLVDSERQCAESIERALLRTGRVLTQAERDFVIGHGWREIYERLALGGALPWSLEVMVARAGEERERIVEEHGLVVLPGALELVRAAAAELRVTVVSGSSRGEIGACLRRLGVSDLIPRYVGAEDVARGKPAPDGYLLGAELLDVDPSEAIVLEDSAAGIAAARAAGMVVVGVKAGNFAGQDQSAADLVVDDLTALDMSRLSEAHAATHAVASKVSG